MYTTKSEQNRQQQQAALLRRKQRFRRWMLLNGILATAIVLVGVVYWLQEQPSTQSIVSAAEHADYPATDEQAANSQQTLRSATTPEQDSVAASEQAPQSDDAAAAESAQADNEHQASQDQSAETPDQTSSDQQAGNEQQRDSEATPVQRDQSDSAATATDKPATGDTATAPNKQPSTAPLAPQTDTTPQGQTVTLNFGGDVMFAGKVGELLQQKGYDYPYQYVKKLFTSDDLTVVNLETPVTGSNTTAADKTYTFKSAPEALPHMAAAGIDAVNLANNHILDQGVVGLNDTIRQLDASGVQYVGAGADAARAYKPVIFERKGIKIALLGFSRVIPNASWNAGTNQPGVATAYDPTAAEAAIRKAKSEADLVVVIAHWGIERSDATVNTQTELAHDFIDAGADLVVGGHPHVLQGVEQYKGKWIAYSTGNFIFTHSLTEKTWDTGVFQAVCSVKGQCSMKVIPYTATLGQPVPMEQQPAQALLQRLQSLSVGVRFDGNGNAIPSK
ncbi:CapA family protein [Paenibacillus campi]|uniref:CapA family protein n=1 Tax=Paenibacillus campi TaxID=3106031 RepID=UPI002AFEBA28|nr:CapA family protein [Paenibacillus sp. SGZ-1014]